MRKHREPTRTRVHGTRNTDTGGDPDKKIAALRQIVAEKQYAKIDGLMVDLFSASACVAVYDALSESSRAKFTAMPIRTMCLVAMKCIE